MENYIVRIYRRDPDNPRIIAGQVEDVSDGSMHPFTSLEALSEIFAHDEELAGIDLQNENTPAPLSKTKQLI